MLQGGLVMAKFDDWNWETIFTDNIGLYIQPLRRIWLAKKSKSAKNRKMRAITSFKVNQGHQKLLR